MGSIIMRVIVPQPNHKHPVNQDWHMIRRISASYNKILQISISLSLLWHKGDLSSSHTLGTNFSLHLRVQLQTSNTPIQWTALWVPMHLTFRHILSNFTLPEMFYQYRQLVLAALKFIPLGKIIKGVELPSFQ